MRNYKQSIVEKFKKKDQICNICQLEKELSEDHVPPKACPPAKNIVIYKLLSEMTGDRSFRPRMSQNGVTYKTICSDCNNKLGNRYDWALGEFTGKIESFVESSLTLPNSFEVECYPNAIMRSVLGHLLAAKTQTDEVVIDKLIRPCILDTSLPIPNDVHILYWVYPYERISILRDFGMPAVRGNFQTSGFFNMIKFYPIAFLITHQLPSYEGLLSLDKFKQLSPNDKANVQIDLRPIRRSTFPEECTGVDNFLMLGRTANDSVYAVSKSKKTKN
ncbi:MAG: hypothetical protein RMX35_19540 [Nostoc sp. DcaGUA01]|nr:hypothetical protein [Nostoc sp. DcaGUA01]